ncbi:MAG: hypothetical protein JJ882_14365 [Balneola sp.]|nr:hypothetical protein [Balneola sp.]
MFSNIKLNSSIPFDEKVFPSKNSIEMKDAQKFGGDLANSHLKMIGNELKDLKKKKQKKD